MELVYALGLRYLVQTFVALVPRAQSPLSPAAMACRMEAVAADLHTVPVAGLHSPLPKELLTPRISPELRRKLAARRQMPVQPFEEPNCRLPEQPFDLPQTPEKRRSRALSPVLTPEKLSNCRLPEQPFDLPQTPEQRRSRDFSPVPTPEKLPQLFNLSVHDECEEEEDFCPKVACNLWIGEEQVSQSKDDDKPPCVVVELPAEFNRRTFPADNTPLEPQMFEIYEMPPLEPPMFEICEVPSLEPQMFLLVFLFVGIPIFWYSLFWYPLFCCILFCFGIPVFCIPFVGTPCFMIFAWGIFFFCIPLFLVIFFLIFLFW